MYFGKLRRRTKRSNPQAGYLLIVLMIMVTILAMAAIKSAPSMATQIKRDREEELVHRGAQYARAVKKFYKKFGRYPLSIDQLQNTNNMRFLRRKYQDPITGKEFRLLHFGEVKLTPKGPGSTTGPGAVPSGAVSGLGDTNQPTGSQLSSGPKSGDASADSAKTSVFGSSPAGTGPTFGGGPIIGVISTSTKTSLKEFNQKNHYNEWEFVYDPTMDRGGLIKGPYVPTKAGIGGVVPGMPGGLTPTVTPQGGLNPFPSPNTSTPQ